MEQARDQYLVGGVWMAVVAILEWIFPAIFNPLSWVVTAGVFFILAALKTVQIKRKNKASFQP